jgi:hypothetical protein
MSSPEALSNLPVAPSDPVEMRRLKFQTPAMMSHPPIHIADLEEHINNLKTSDNLKFSQEYEVIFKKYQPLLIIFGQKCYC